MLKGLLIGLCLLFTVNSQALTIVDVVTEQTTAAILADAANAGLNWKVGDNANYNLNAGFIKGKMNMVVREKNADGFWVDQNMDLGFMGKQKSEMLIDAQTGQVKKILVNGQEQQLPDPGDYEVIDITEDHITVPAGAFDCLHVKARDKKQNQEVNQWVNPQQVPIMGLLKTIAPSQMGQVVVELVNFKKN